MNWTPVKAPSLGLWLGLLPGLAAAEQPLSAIDWLNAPVPVTTRITPQTSPAPTKPEPPVSKSALAPDVSVSSLDEAGVAAVGLLPKSVTGLPASLWQASKSADLVREMRAQDPLALPALQSLFYTLILAEAEPPFDAGRGHDMLKERVAQLMELGAVEPAQALLERAGPDVPQLFALWFDVTLLTGTEDAACSALNAKRYLSTDMATRIYCEARGGDWAAAAVSYDTASALGLLSPVEKRLLALFIDPELIEEAADLAPPSTISPLAFRLYEAAGQALPTGSLPRAFAMADLRATSGWKAELEAAERLSRTGALSENRLFDIYTARQPAASGGIWDRVEALQRFDTAVRSRDPGAVARTLPPAWRAMQDSHLEVPFARYYAQALAPLPMTGEAHELAFAIAMLSPDYESLAAKMTPQTDEERFLAALARGEPQNAPTSDPLSRSIARAFSETEVPRDLAPLLAEGKLGEAILRAMTLFASGMEGNYTDLDAALAGFRAMGLEDTARRAGLQLMLLNQG
ncbi:hypothetical protein [Rhodalgimonas zhirmunskyi]|uniref:hypothetical protein n=1 Tax=Rhodalgimonas zhirmunskyi TaxID=2964767 RepID=UPI0029529448|nr:hypothetical protein [Rhodoalgimonas zhirmunskyi]